MLFRLLSQFVIGFSIALCPFTCAFCEYAFTDLGTLGGNHSSAVAINNVGQIVGNSLTGSGERHPTLWNGSIPSDIGTLGGTSGSAFAINDSGQIAGTTSTFAGFSHATGWYGGVRVDLGMVDNPSGTGATSGANGIDNAGRIVGSGQTADYFKHATLWKASNEMKDLGPGGELVQGHLNAINNQLQAVGWRRGSSTSPQLAARWDSILTFPAITVLNSLGGTNSYATAINDLSLAVGTSQVASGAFHAVRWDGSIATDLGTLGGNTSYAYGLNNSGQIVGQSQLLGGSVHATIWNGTSILDLNSQLDPSVSSAGWILNSAFDINENGWIVGNALNSVTGETHGFLLRPITIPEPSSTVLAMLLSAIVMTRRKQDVAGLQSENCPHLR